MVRTRNCWLLFWEGDDSWKCWPKQWYEEVQIKGLFLLFPFNCFGISLVNDQTPVYTQHNTVLLHHHQQCILSISFQGSTNAIYWLLDGVRVHIYTGLYVASVEFCNSLNVMLSNHPSDIRLKCTLKQHYTCTWNIDISSSEGRQTQLWHLAGVNEHMFTQLFVCLAYLWGFVTVFR